MLAVGWGLAAMVGAVSGFTISRGFDHRIETRVNRTQNRRSERRKRTRFVQRFNTTNWCRKATISSPRSNEAR